MARLSAAVSAVFLVAILAGALPAGAQQAVPAPASTPPEAPVDIASMDSCLKAAVAPAAKYACIGQAALSCQQQPGQDNTAGMSNCFAAELDWWKARLNDSYDKLEALHRDSDAKGVVAAGFVPQTPALEAAQKAWLAYREAQCAYQQGFWQGGSGAGPALLSCEMILTGQRAIDLGATLLQAETR